VRSNQQSRCLKQAQDAKLEDIITVDEEISEIFLNKS